MAVGEYNVVFRGVLTGAKPEDEVKAELGRMFKASADHIEALFTGKPVVVKRGLDAETAGKFRAAFQKAGAICEVVKAGSEEPAPQSSVQSSAPAPAQAGTEAEPAPPADASGSDSGAASERNAGHAVELSGDPHGTVLERSVSGDLSALSIDESGTPHQPHEDVPEPQFDLSGLSLADDEGPLSQRPNAPERSFDTSGLSLEPLEEKGSDD